ILERHQIQIRHLVVQPCVAMTLTSISVCSKSDISPVVNSITTLMKYLSWYLIMIIPYHDASGQQEI
ncbi:MAG: hypothetical protein ACREA5_04420, partial [Nitrosotalea sp.]